MNDLFVFQNPNPAANRTEDCAIRSICILENMDWLTVYWKLCALGAQMYIMPNNSKAIVKAFLVRHGYRAHSFPDTCPDCYTIRNFCMDYPEGKYLLTTNNHMVAVIDGKYYDSFDSGDEVCVSAWHKEES